MMGDPSLLPCTSSHRYRTMYSKAGEGREAEREGRERWRGREGDGM